MLADFEGLMRVMAQDGVTFQSFRIQTERLYAQAAVDVCKGNHSEAARKIGLHRNHLRRILGSTRVKAYVQAVYQNGGIKTDDK